MITISLTSLLGFILPALMVLGVAGWALIRHTATKAVEHAFNRDLESHKANLQKTGTLEIEKLKIDWSAELNRKNKLLDREFEALPKIWDKVQIALGAVQVVAILYRPPTDAYNMNNEQLEYELSKLDIPDHCKDEIRQAPNVFAGEPGEVTRQIAFSRYEHGARLVRASKTTNDARNFLIGQGIFINQTINAQLMDLLDLALRAIDEEVQNHQFSSTPGNTPSRTHCDAFMSEAGQRAVELAKRIRERLGVAD